MRLITFLEMAELEIFQNRTLASITSFVRNRGVKPIGRGKKKGDAGSAPLLFDIDEIYAAWQRKPLKNKFAGGVEPYQRRKYKKPEECTDEFEYGSNAPFRNIKCPDYYECYSKVARASFKSKGRKECVLDCSNCEKKDIEDPFYLNQGIL